ncbi:MBL fold metallo-hydrolase [Piscinibacter sp. XHJ-5]|uniref:MBL fold metallo-hydrolase n=1 Tax=Piscinibacter sp. XHJ-5 TaxID=3037797 RepID=UPI0024533806|nr:MBL fold metallo-hydrolase [Piscinibacter sp. XHJ-5]
MRRAVLALLALIALAVLYVAVQASRHPSLDPYRHLILPPAPATARGVRVTFAGNTTLLFDDGETAWMTDGFFTRPPVSSLIGRIAPDPATVDRMLRRLEVTRLAAVVPVHSHYDHAMDAPVVADRTGALLVGSASTLNIGRGAGLAEKQMREVKPGDTLPLGRFTLSFVASRHSPTPFTDGMTPDPVAAPLVPPARATAWREGQTWSIFVEHPSGFRALVQGSAGFIPGALSGRRADIVFLGVATLGKKDEAYRTDYWNEVVKRVGAKRVIPIHWDTFWRSLDEPLVPMPLLADNFGVAMDDLLKRAGPDHVEVRLPPPLTPFVP